MFCSIGAFIYLSLSIILPQKISGQILKRDIKIAQYLSREVQEPLLVNNRLALKLLLEDRLESLGDIIYIFIRGRDGSIIASTFQKGFPKGLVHINEKISESQKPGGDIYSVEKFLVNGKKVYDIAIPLLKGELGSLHAGVSLESNKTEIATFSKIKYYVATVIFIGLGVGILIFALLGIFLSSRIIKLKNFATRIGQGDLDGNIDMKTDDEIGALAIAFNKMAKSLKEKIEEVKRLSGIEERNRLALDLHDGCAQDIANIIKRVELCEKLFLQDQHQGLEELNALKKTTKDFLQRTRGIIFNLKSPEGPFLDLNRDIFNYVNNYRIQNNIHVVLTISDPLRDLPREKTKDIFYFIVEALNNVKMHSQADNVQLSISRDSGQNIVININDDGRGFDVNNVALDALLHGKLGLMGMRQRVYALGGELSIVSEIDQGTKISARVPITTKQTEL